MNYIGLLVEILYIFFIIILITIFLKKGKLTNYESRKLIHIGLSNTFLIACIFFDNYLYAALLPLLFIFINYYSYKNKTITAIEIDRKEGLGTVFYALSLFVLTLFLFITKRYLYIGILTTLILGYADGLAALIGTKIGKRTFKNNKTLEGSLIVFIVSYLISYFVLSLNDYDSIFRCSFIIASYSCILEVLFSKGFDNLILPIILPIIIYLLTNNLTFFDFNISLSINLMMALFAISFKVLDIKGVVGAVILGTTVHYILGTPSYIALLSYLLISNSTAIIFKIGKKKKLKNEERGIKQVFFNGIIPFIATILYCFNQDNLYKAIFLLGLASSCSDTFGGEFGKTSNEKVRYIISKKEVIKGSSGGVTTKGIIGSLIAAILMGLFSFFIFQNNQLYYFLTISIFATLASLIDSIMGELLQIKYLDLKTKQIVENPEFKIKDNYQKISGFKYIGNSMVNFLSIITSCLLFTVMYYLV